MEKTFNSIWIHLVLGTRYNGDFSAMEIKKSVHDFIRHQLEEMQCAIRIIHCADEQVHCLFELNTGISVDQIVKQVKKNTADFINGKKLLPHAFDWRQGYSVFSVTRSELKEVETNIVARRKDNITDLSYGIRKHTGNPFINPPSPPGIELPGNKISLN